MRRRAKNVLTALSLALSLAVVALWARSYWYEDVALRSSTWGSLYLDSFRGRLVFTHCNLLDRPMAYWQSGKLAGDETLGPDLLRTRRNRLGFVFQNVEEPGIGTALRRIRAAGGRAPAVARTVHAGVPHWLLAAVFAAGPAARVPGWAVRRARRRRGLCPACGYDVRATPGRCPECGTAAGL